MGRKCKCKMQRKNVRECNNAQPEIKDMQNCTARILKGCSQVLKKVHKAWPEFNQDEGCISGIKDGAVRMFMNKPR